MSIEIILKEHVEHLGRHGEIVKVANGYARNYRSRAARAAVTAQNKQLVERERAKAEARDAEEQMTAQALASRIEAVELSIARRVGENETLFGSVTSADIAESLAERGLPVDRRRIQLADPLKSLGDHVVPVKLHREVTAQIKVKIVPATA
jgi:large subunit ribosomal protein L9